MSLDADCTKAWNANSALRTAASQSSTVELCELNNAQGVYRRELGRWCLSTALATAFSHWRLLSPLILSSPLGAEELWAPVFEQSGSESTSSNGVSGRFKNLALSLPEGFHRSRSARKGQCHHLSAIISRSGPAARRAKTISPQRSCGQLVKMVPPLCLEQSKKRPACGTVANGYVGERGGAHW